MDGIGKSGGYRDTAIGNDYAKDLANKRGKEGVEMADFFKLFAAQMQNQDFMNPMDNSQFLTQMAQFQSMQAMQTLAAQMNNTYAISMIGKSVVCADYAKDGTLQVTEGVVDGVSLTGGQIRLSLKGHEGKTFTMKNIMEVRGGEAKKPADKPEEIKPDEKPQADLDLIEKPDTPRED